jgi:CheY-like chemotaxis protein
MTGEEFREMQRNDPEICDIPIVVVSAKHDACETARRMNAAAFSPKPLDADLLIDAITHCCAGDP